MQLAEVERQLAKAPKGSDEERELNRLAGLWRKYYKRAKKQDGELPRDLSLSPEEQEDREKFEEDKANVTFINLDEDDDDQDEKPPKKYELGEKIEFYKANKDKLFSFSRDQLESMIIQQAENLRMRGKLSKLDEVRVKQIIPDYEPLQPNDGTVYRPEKLKKLPRENEELPKLPKLPTRPSQFVTRSPIDTGYRGYEVFKTEYKPEMLKRRGSENVINLREGSPVRDVITVVRFGTISELDKSFGSVDLSKRTKAEREEINKEIADAIKEARQLRNDKSVEIEPELIQTLMTYQRKVLLIGK